jgi:hypothetical protein
MKLELAKRSQAKIKMAILGPAGSGKTMGALQIAYGICGDWGKIAVIDTENYSASLYAHLGGYSVLNIGAPFTPEKYSDAINLCAGAGMEVIIIDSISHEWEGAGGILDIHAGMAGNSFTNWGKLTPRHNAFIQTIIQTNAHIIATIRSKQDYVLNEKNGKHVPEKVGLKGVSREGTDYEMTLVLDLDIKHNATASKDRTGLFMDKPEFKLSPEIGRVILNWCQQGDITEELSHDFIERINSCNSIVDLNRLYILYPKQQQSYGPHFSRRKKELLPTQAIGTNSLTTQNSSHNGNV